MRGYLLDTNVLIWELESHPRLEGPIRELFHSGAPCWVSIVSLWEMTIKASLGKLQPLDPMLSTRLERAGFTLLPIDWMHLGYLQTLPHHHRDPFDRLLVAQAQAERLTILTADRAILQYDVATRAA